MHLYFSAVRGLVIPITFCFRVCLNASAFGVQREKVYAVDARVHTRSRVGEKKKRGSWE